MTPVEATRTADFVTDERGVEEGVGGLFGVAFERGDTAFEMSWTTGESGVRSLSEAIDAGARRRSRAEEMPETRVE